MKAQMNRPRTVRLMDTAKPPLSGLRFTWRGQPPVERSVLHALGGLLRFPASKAISHYAATYVKSWS
jgi:hypothetical protein